MFDKKAIKLRTEGLIILIFSSLLTLNACSQIQGPQKHFVEIKRMKFVPEKLFIKAGDTVVWINRDFFAHDVTELNNKAWSSGTLEKGVRWQKIFSKSGSYYCSLHVVMKGRIIVK